MTFRTGIKWTLTEAMLLSWTEKRQIVIGAASGGNYRRALDSTCDGKQIGRRAIITCGAVVVSPWSDVYTPQQLANTLIAVPFHAGTHYLTIQMLEGFLPRELIRVCDSSRLTGDRYHSMMRGEVDACSVAEPYITTAERNECRVIV